VLIAWVPDDCKVRDKMLYSSSREDLKRSLGLGYFVGEYYANTRGDMTWDQFLEYISRERTDGPLSAKEQLILEEKALTHSESHSTKATAMGALPFELSSSVISALGQLQSGAVNWIEMYLNQETVELAEAKEVDPKEPLQSHVCSTDARCDLSSVVHHPPSLPLSLLGRFLALRLPDPDSPSSAAFYFVYSCPESTLVRTKMTMSSSKATVLAAASAQGISFSRSPLLPPSPHRSFSSPSPDSETSRSAPLRRLTTS
jgi:twinfilin